MAIGQEIHERLARDDAVKGSSDRAFGIVFAIVFAVIGVWPVTGGGDVRLWSLGVGAAFLLVALARPALLKPLKRLWTKFGLLVHQIANPVVMGLVFYLVVTPTALVRRALGKDPLNRRLDPHAETYWIEREPPGPAREPMKQQF